MRHVKLRPDVELGPTALKTLIEAAYADAHRRINAESLAIPRDDGLG
jgi:hypothetical protein